MAVSLGQRNVCALAAMAAVLIAGETQASPVTETYTFNLGGFADVRGGATPPATAATGMFTVTFDPTVVTQTTSTGLSNVSTAGVTVDSTFNFSYFPTLKLLSFGGAAYGAGALAAGTNDLAVQILLPTLDNPVLATCADPGYSCGGASGNAAYTSSAYTTTGQVNSFFFASTAASSVAVLLPVQVPEPVSVTVLAAGLTGLALGRRRRSN